MKTQEQKTQSFNLRLPSKKLKTQLTKIAKSQNRSLNQHLIHVLEIHVAESAQAKSETASAAA